MLAGQSVVETHYNISFVFHPFNPYPEALNDIITNCKGCTIKPLPHIQCDTSTSPALPIHPEQSACLLWQRLYRWLR